MPGELPSKARALSCWPNNLARLFLSVQGFVGWGEGWGGVRGGVEWKRQPASQKLGVVERVGVPRCTRGNIEALCLGGWGGFKWVDVYGAKDGDSSQQPAPYSNN